MQRSGPPPSAGPGNSAYAVPPSLDVVVSSMALEPGVLLFSMSRGTGALRGRELPLGTRLENRGVGLLGYA